MEPGQSLPVERHSLAAESKVPPSTVRSAAAIDADVFEPAGAGLEGDTVLSFWRVAPLAGDTTTSDRSCAIAEACVVVLVVVVGPVRGPPWAWLVGAPSAAGLPWWLTAETPATIATTRRAPTTAMPADQTRSRPR